MNGSVVETGTPPLAHRIRRTADARALMTSLIAGLVLGLSSVVNTMGAASLAFQGPLQAHLGTAIGALLACGGVGAVIGALFASYRGTLMENQESAAMIMGFMGAALVTTLPTGLAMEDKAATVLLLFALTTAATGLTLLVLGVLRLGELIRYIPFPVIGGVLAGLGLLMAEGGLSVATGLGIKAENLPLFLTSEYLVRWVPALGFAGILMAVTARWKHFLVVPTLLVAGIAAFYLSTGVLGLDSDTLRTEGWLVGPFPKGSLLTFPDPAALGRLDPSFLIGHLPAIGTVVLVSTIGVLLHASGLELAVREDLDLDRELRVCGTGNLLGSVFGGVPAFHSLSGSLLMQEMGAARRLTPLITVGVWVVVLIFGGAVLSFFPRVVLAGLLLFMGLSLLSEWLLNGWKTLPRSDWTVIAMIVATTAFIGYLEGIGLGVVAGVILFQVAYTKVDVVKHALSGATCHSNVERSERARNALRTEGDRLLILQLQGYVFFGTANNILRKARAFLDAPRPHRIEMLVLDLRLVEGMDWAAITSFKKLLQIADKQDLRLILTGGHVGVRSQLAKGGILNHERVDTFETFDLGLAWCEDRLLGELGVPSAEDVPAGALPEWVRAALPASEQQARLLEYLAPLSLAEGDVLMHQGEPSDSLYFVRGGQASVYIELGGGARLRVKSYLAGSVVGEIGLYLGTPRSATVMADSPLEVYRLSQDAFDRMREQDPALAARFHEMIVGLLGTRVTDTNRLLAALMA